MRILNQAEDDILRDERKLLIELQNTLLQFDALESDLQTVQSSIHQLDELFLMVVVGEFNSGKSAFINAFLGQRELKEGVTPTTTRINILQFGEKLESIVQDDRIHRITLPIETLKDINVVDTPGTNAVIREHEVVTSRFVPRSDLVIFITSADRPFTESERSFLERIRDWGKKVVIVVNKIDILQDDSELEQVFEFINENVRSLLGIKPPVFMISARNALLSKEGQSALWEESRFEALEEFIHDTLDEGERVKLKLTNPLGVGQHLVSKYQDIVKESISTIQEDLRLISDVESQLAVYQTDMERDFDFRMADIENILLEMEQRGIQYFDDTIRIVNIFELLKKGRVQKDFEEFIVADVPDRIETSVDELIDWLVEADLHQWQGVSTYLADRRRKHHDRIVGDQQASSFHYDRGRLIDSIGRDANRVVESYDKTSEARALADGVKAAIAAAAALEVGALGLGTLVAILASTAAADVTGILVAGVIATLGLFVLPARRRVAKNEMRSKVADLRMKLMKALRSHFEHEIKRSLTQITESFAPYSRFIRIEQERLSKMTESLEEFKTKIEALKMRIEEIV
jgi:small GTP-binding protein